MKTPKQIDHIGTIEKIENGVISVSILNVSACAGCHAKGACSMADMKEKSIEIIDYSNQYKVGDKVNVAYRESLGWVALLLAYVLPFVMVLLAMFVTAAFTDNELWIGLNGLIILVPYYAVLALFKHKLKKTFSFTIQKIV
ncbi:MAG: SoxR reducing system RseC family protein [Marinifilaceae bacterium]